MSDAPTPLFRMPIALRWRDLDAFNHVNNSNFMTYLEEARIRWFDSLGEAWVTDTTAPLLAAVQMNYRVPIPYPANVVVELGCERLGTSSVTLSHRIVGEDEADPTKGSVSHVSPLARALIGKDVGDSVEVATPGGQRSYEILAIRYE